MLELHLTVRIVVAWRTRRLRGLGGCGCGGVEPVRPRPSPTRLTCREPENENAQLRCLQQIRPLERLCYLSVGCREAPTVIEKETALLTQHHSGTHIIIIHITRSTTDTGGRISYMQQLLRVI